MMSMVGVELTNFVNPNLTWKTVSKGSRSASRRPRKLDSRSFKMGLYQSDNSSRTEDTSASDSEKLGAVVLGQRFGDRVEHVPIKKRKFLFRSLSPPPGSPSPHREDSQQLVSSGGTSGKSSSPSSVSKQGVESVDASTAIKFSDTEGGVADGNISGVTKRKLGYGEGFSGIEILVAAACNDNMIDDGDPAAADDMVTDGFLAREGINTSSAVPLKETVSIIDNSVHQDDLNGSVPTFPTSRDDKTEENSLSLHVDRSHWDLNTIMDAWGKPCANVVDSPKDVKNNVSKDVVDHEIQEEVKGFQISKDSGDDTDSTIQFMVPKNSTDACSYMHPLPSSSRSLTLDASNLSGDDSGFRLSSELISLEKKCASTCTEPAPESSALAGLDAQTSTEAVSTDVRLDFASCAVSNCMRTTLIPEEIQAEPSSDKVKQMEDIVPGTDLGKSVKSETALVEERNVNFTHVPVSEKTTFECFVKKECEDSAFAYLSPADKLLTRLDVNKCQSPGSNSIPKGSNSIPRGKSGKVMDISLSSPMHEELPASVASGGEVKPRLTDDAASQDDEALKSDRTAVNSPTFSGQKDTVDKPSTDPPHCSREVLVSQEFDDGQDQEFRDGQDQEFQDGPDQMVSIENMTEFQEGYESQYEDGELREPLVQSASDIDAEDGETEQVDYESDDRDMYDVDDADHTVSFESNVRESSCQPSLTESLVTNTLDGETSKRQSVNPPKMPLRREPLRKEGFEKLEMVSTDMNEKTEHSSGGDSFKTSSQLESSNAKWTPWDQQPDGCRASSDVAKEEANNVNMRKKHSIGCVEGPDAKDIPTRVAGSREPKRGMPSCGEGPSSFNLLRRNRTAHLQQRRSNDRNDNTCVEDERGPCGSDRPLGRMRSSLRMHGRGRGRGSQFDDHRLGLWNSKHHQFHDYDGPYDSRKPRPKSIVINSDSKGEDDDLPMYSPSKVYRPFVRRRPTRRDDNYHLHKGMPARDLSPDRRSGRYPQRLSSPKDGYFRSLPNDSDESYVRVSHNLGRRERSFSPVFPRGGEARFSHPHQRYRSRSRSRSPFLQQQLPRDRSAVLRPLSRSPDFRSEARMERGRFPFRKPGFEPDYDVDFMSPPPRRRFSPKRNPRWMDERNRPMDEFRNRRSPGRIFQQSHRFNSPGSPEQRLKPDYFRPGMRGGRLPNLARGGRGDKDVDEDDDYRRKPSSRYQMFHPGARRYSTDGGGARRFQYDDADGFEAHDTDNKDDCVGSIDKRQRDMPRGGRERQFNNMWS